jgi:digeranylgeranylglycerophospholipid reductase
MAKVLIIGGGPAGLYASMECAESGLDTTLLERKKIGDDIRCAEGFFDVLKLLGMPEAGVRFKVEKIIVRAKSTYYFDARKLFLWMIDRRVWQTELAKMARQKGVRIEEDSCINPGELNALQKQYDCIIDASGAPSVTSRAYGFSDFYKNNSGKTVQYVVQGDFSHIGNCLKVGLLPELWGYYWIFPKGKDENGRYFANVGAGNFNPSRQVKLWKLLEHAMDREGLDNKNYNVINKLGGMCPTKMLERLRYDNILLAGDAAGLASPLHGGGIDMAVLSGIYAARAVKEGIETYEKKLRMLLEKRLEFEGILSRVWMRKSFDEMDRLIKKITGYKLYKAFYNPKFINRSLIKLVALLLNDNKNPA